MLEKIRKLNKLLIDYFGLPKRNIKPPDPVDMLIGTILSQNTNDQNSFKAFQNLKDKFSSWDEAVKFPPSKIENYIKIAGLGKQKSKSIKSVLKYLLKKNKKISLDYLKQKDDKSVINELTAFRGVGVKTASCVLLFAMNRNVCPVDTHVHRTLNRIGLVNTSTPDKTFKELEGNLPDGVAHSFHTNLIRLGREVCKASRPKCSICPVENVCSFNNKIFDENDMLVKNDFMLLDNIR